MWTGILHILNIHNQDLLRCRRLTVAERLLCNSFTGVGSSFFLVVNFLKDADFISFYPLECFRSGQLQIANQCLWKA